MLNAESVVTNFLTELFQNDLLVNTVIYGKPDGKDLNKSNIFPLVHIAPATVNFDENRIDFEFPVAVFDIRDIRNDSSEGKIFSDNLIDSLNTATSIIGRVLTTLSLQNNDLGIELIAHTQLDSIVFSDKNILDGRQFTLTLSIQNTISVCQ